MHQILKKRQPKIWVFALCFSLAFAIGCNGDSKDKKEPEKPAMESGTVTEKSTTDSLPPLDSNASSRPEDIKNEAK